MYEDEGMETEGDGGWVAVVCVTVILLAALAIFGAGVNAAIKHHQAQPAPTCVRAVPA